MNETTVATIGQEEVLRKSNMVLKASGNNCVYVTEDFSRRVRKHREALLSYARELRDRLFFN